MPEELSVRFEMRLSPALAAKVDRWRGGQPDVPPRAEAIRRLLELGLKMEASQPTER